MLTGRNGAYVENAFLDLLAVGSQTVVALVVGQVVDIVVLVEDVDSAGVDVIPLDADVLIHLLHFIVLRLGLHVAEENAVHDELSVVGRVAEVTTIA